MAVAQGHQPRPRCGGGTRSPRCHLQRELSGNVFGGNHGVGLKNRFQQPTSIITLKNGAEIGSDKYASPIMLMTSSAGTNLSMKEDALAGIKIDGLADRIKSSQPCIRIGKRGAATRKCFRLYDARPNIGLNDWI